MTAYYNEFDPVAARWLVNLIEAGHIAPGYVDTRSIEDVTPNDLVGFTQCHFFAGIGVWSYSLRRAGWPDSRPVWTASCPCQPFSAAGEGAGFDDQRHLWPALHWLIGERLPSVIYGEQVASSLTGSWIDLVHADLEALGYAFGSVPFPSAGVGAPHIRDRNYWVAQSSGQRRERGQGASRRSLANRDDAGRIEGHHGIAGADEISVRLGDAIGAGLAQRERERGILSGAPGAVKGQATIGAGVHLVGLADTGGERRNGRLVCVRAEAGERSPVDLSEAGRGRGALLGPRNAADSGDVGPLHPAAQPGPTNGFWRDADWLGCRDGKWRPVEPGTFPLAHGASARVGRLRAYGNAINAEAAIAFIRATLTA